MFAGFESIELHVSTPVVIDPLHHRETSNSIAHFDGTSELEDEGEDDRSSACAWRVEHDGKNIWMTSKRGTSKLERNYPIKWEQMMSKRDEQRWKKAID